MTASKKVWIGRAILVGLIIAIVVAVVYLFTVPSEPQPVQSSNAPPANEHSSESTAADSAKTVKNAYQAYIKTAYDEESPNPEVALRKFKAGMTSEGQAAIGEYSKEKDAVLCTKGIPSNLSFTKPTVLKSTAVISVVSVLEKGTAQAVVTVDTSEQKIAGVSCQ